MKYKNMLWFGLVFVCISMGGMLVAHEFAVSEIVFIIGTIIAGIGYAKLLDSEKQAINTDRVNKNIQILNEILWGKQEKP